MSEMAKLGALNNPLGKYPRKAQYLREQWGGCCWSLGDGCPGAVYASALLYRTASPSAAEVQQCQSSLLKRTK